MSELSTKELFMKLQNKLIIDLKENEVLCPECKGLRFVLVESNEKAYIESCKRCYTGKLYICKYCGELYKSQCNCKEYHNARHEEFRLKQTQKDFEAYQKAEKIHYKDYDGKFILDDDDYIKDIDDVAEWIYDKLSEGEEVPEYLWATIATPHFSIDLKDVISDKCEDGYEDMYSHLDIKSPLISQAQDLINQWEKDQGESLYIYTETYKKAVIIKDLIEEIKKEITSKG